MTRSQFAMAVGAEEKWVENAARILGKRLRYTPLEGAWLGLVRVLSQDVGLSLLRASELASEALDRDAHTPMVVLGDTNRTNAGIAVDIARYHSSYAATLSAALELGGARRRGRPRPDVTRRDSRVALHNAAHCGIDLGLLREGLKIPVAERLRLADENASFVRELRSSKRSKA